MSFFGKNIYFLRKLHKLQQAEMPDFIGISRGRWSEYERDNTEPDFDALITVADFFGVTLDTLLKHDISTDVQLIERLEKVKIRKIVQGNVKGYVQVTDHYRENLVLSDSGGDDSKLSLYQLAQQIAEMRKDINELKANKK